MKATETKPSRAPWTTREIRVLRDAYPAGGINAVILQLPHRSRTAIYQHAHALGLRCASQPLVRESWKLEPGMDDAIISAHQRPMQRGDVVALAARLQRPVWWVSRRARDLNLTTPRFREAPWSADEVKLLRETRNLKPASAQRLFKRAGYLRTATAIQVQRKRRDVHRDPSENHSSRDIARLIGHNESTVSRWIRMGMLTAKHDPQHKPSATGNTPYMVTDKALRQFIIEHPIRIDLRKIPAGHTPWFVDLLAGTRVADFGDSTHG